MGKGDTALSAWLGDKERFADLFNGTVFQGEQIVEAENLELEKNNTKELISEKAGHLKNIERNRDIVMKWNDGISLAILACENQENIHYAMPVRTMLYDGLSYAEQIRQLGKGRKLKNSSEFLSGMQKDDKLCPIATIVFYYGDQEWDGSTDLYGLLKESNDPKVGKILAKMIPNYHINLLDINKLGDISVYNTDLQVVLGMLQCRKDKKKVSSYIQENEEYFKNVDVDTYNVLRVLLKAEKQLEEIKQKDKEEIDMCEALQGIFDDGVERGIEQGVRVLIESFKELGLPMDMTKNKVIEKFSLDEEKAAECMKKYWK